MTEKAKDRDVCGLQSSVPCTGVFLHILNCFLLLLLQKEVHGCPSVCQLCTGKQVNCRNLGLSSIPKNFPKSTVLVYLSGNNISHVIPNELTGLQKLAVLYLDNSSISYVHPKAFVELSKLCYLHLNNNHIKRLDPGIFEGLSDLHCLYLQNNQISFVPRGLFSGLISVRYLTLERNRLSILGSGTFLGMISLQTLNLANNKISRISDTAFHHLGNLVYLYLEGNNLTHVPSKAIGILKNLERLSLSHNPVGSIHPFAFKGLDRLEYLSLKSAKIKSIIMNGFAGLNNLKKLILSHNDLEHVNSNTFTSLHNLMYLQLDKNKIVSIGDNAFEKMGSFLKILNLASNNLTDLQPKVLKPLVSLTHLQANNNPWNCSCTLLGLRNWLALSSISVKIHCQNPPSMRGRPLHYVKWTEFTNCAITTTNPETAWSVASVGIHHSTATLVMAWRMVTTYDTLVHLENAGTKRVTFWGRAPTTSASRFLYEEYAAGNPSEATTVLSVLPVQTAAQIVPVNLTMEQKSEFPPDAASVSLKTSLICTQQVEKLNQAFDILLAFFILACAVILFLIYKIVQFRQKLKMLGDSGEKGIEYYSSYQAGRYNVTDPVQSLPQNPMRSSELDQIKFIKRTMPESQAQVILFEHSAL
ncbi:leucine-rich repeat-containing protein 70 [Terrapene carolina triunguis]|uniref:leucine-rich repeat-containing protein 70 n=1 Tax=Terrapene triunguis TaxID=2587831 RepID=UPI000CEFAB2C|nr:leucine-rich repeat-containing protein 70 [Terrapene carolina triunguis]XP_024070662.1 leucine-rich repeat-containing protein 70 [Terrapene carolina triunguis]XP_024070663.1 leucine-rich repeat-containing protein 70 [Terrapene carolina triunguis]